MPPAHAPWRDPSVSSSRSATTPRRWTEADDAQLQPYLAVTLPQEVARALAADLDRTETAVRLRVHYLRVAAGHKVPAVRPRRSGKYAGRVRPDQAAQRQSPANPPPPRLARRQCLRCRAGFDPAHRGNFLCGACNRANGSEVAP